MKKENTNKKKKKNRSYQKMPPSSSRKDKTGKKQLSKYLYVSRISVACLLPAFSTTGSWLKVLAENEIPVLNHVSYVSVLTGFL